MKVFIMGAGYVGLATAAGLGKNPNLDITVIESNPERLKMLINKQCPIIEPGLKQALFSSTSSIKFMSTDYMTEETPDVIFICVGTPSMENGEVDLSQLYSVVDLLHTTPITNDTLVVIRSTVPSGTTRNVKALFELMEGPVPIVCHHPEFLQQGSALTDFDNAQRIVFGIVDACDEEAVYDYANKLYGEKSIQVISAESSELVKYLNNAFLAVKISFANEAARLAHAVGADYEAVRYLIGADPRIGESFLGSGIGFGGSCLPKDVNGLLAMYRNEHLSAPVIEGSLITNEEVELNLSSTMTQMFHNQSPGRTILLVDGMAFKYGTDDIRNSIILSALVETCFSCPEMDICFVDKLASVNNKTQSRLSRMSNTIYVYDSYEKATETISSYYKIAGAVLSQEFVQDINRLVQILKDNPQVKVLDCRPKQHKRIFFSPEQYVSFVG